MLQSLGVDYIDESEVLTPADCENDVVKWAFTPVRVRCDYLGETLRRITEGAAMIRLKGEPGTGDSANAVTHMCTSRRQTRRIASLEGDESFVAAKKLRAPDELVKEVAEKGELPVVLFTAGGIATPADAPRTSGLPSSRPNSRSLVARSRSSRRRPAQKQVRGGRSDRR